MGVGKYLLLVLNLASLLYISNGCQMDGVGTWLLTQDVEILDTYSGTFWSRATTSIVGLGSITVGGAVNYAPYLNIDLNEDGLFTISTSPGYTLYEENETSEFISFTVNFMCTGGTSNSLIFSVRVQDTNNNPPTFMPTSQYEFTITPPLPPGFQITGCIGDDIVVRDIDLTTSSIEFTIEDNPYFEISYEGRSSTDPKEFLASLKTKDLIRSLSDDLELIISATDVDATQDPSITTYASIIIKAAEEFQFPEDLVFTEPFYMATYTNNQVVLEQTISLQQGFDDEVTFTLDGEYSDDFVLNSTENIVSIEVSTPLSDEILRSGRVILVVVAERQYTSGATATVIIQLPEVLGLEFEQMQYESRIVDNTLENLQLILAQGYEESFNVNLQTEYTSYFLTSIEGNVITLSMSAPLDANIIDENNFISLLVVASNAYGSASAVVTLDIIKDDNFTPTFARSIYTGEYDSNTGLEVEQIILAQGYDQSVLFILGGDHSDFFSITYDGPVITLTSSGVPSEIWPEQQVLLTIEATKPRAVTAATTISIKLPTERELAFEELTYVGTLQEGVLNLEVIVLSTGFGQDVVYQLNEDYESYFTLSPVQNEVTISLSAPIPDGVIYENNFLILTLSASGLHAVPTSTTILIEIIKQDLSTPVFTENIYSGSYLDANSIEIANISLAQGFDSSVIFRLDGGDHSQYFDIIYNDNNNLNLILASDIPSEVIFEEKSLFFNILADKPFTVGANAAVLITFPPELTDATVMRFSQNAYVGSLENNVLSLENIVLESGYEIDTEFDLVGDLEDYFDLQNTDNIITISMQNLLPEDVLENNRYVILDLVASRERATSAVASIVIDIVKEETVAITAFSSAYYKSVYADGLLEDLTITLSEGYDDTVTFDLVGDNSIWFSIRNEGNIVYLSLDDSVDIPEGILDNNEYFLFSIVAQKPNTMDTSAAIFIHLPKETSETILVRFSQTSYVGRIDNGELYAPAITLLGEREPIYFNVTGDYSQYFEVTQISASNVEIRLSAESESLPETIYLIPFIAIDIEAQYPDAISGHTTVIFEVVKESELITPVFDQAYYIGEYSAQEGLQLEHSIQLIQGFDETVVFTLAGDDAEWFEIQNINENNFTLVLRDDSLAEVTDRSYLIFTVVATKIGSVTVNAAVIINFSDTTITIPLRFEQNFYKGTIEDGVLSLSNINMIEGFSSNLDVSFTGDHEEYFQLTDQENGFILQLLSELPSIVVNDNNVLVFTLEVQEGNSEAHATIILELVKSELSLLAFEEVYYVGSYSTIDGFTFIPQITLTEGYDETVSFSLDGDDSQYFEILQSGSTVSLMQDNPIPTELIVNSRPLVFTIRAARSDTLVTASATIVITLVNESEFTILRFSETTYMGSMENDAVDLDSITLVEGYSQNVEFSLQGDLRNYFDVSNTAATVTIILSASIPENLIPSNRMIVLELQATAPNAVSAFSSIVIEVIQEETEAESLVFSNVYYTGYYTETEGLTFASFMFLSEGFDENVTFELEGDDAQYFEMVDETSNSISLRVRSEIPSDVILDNHHLIFTIRAEKPEAITGRATIVIALLDESEFTILRFSETTYMGSMENDAVDLDSITLVEGYSQNVEFSLQGDLRNYFDVSNTAATVTIILSASIPENLIPSNRMIVLELQATAPNAVSAFSSIVIEVIQEETEAESLVFSNVYYTGYYTETEGLTFASFMFLSEGFDANVTFELEGDDAQYFEMVDETSNSISLRVRSEIPSDVILDNHHLIFTIRADKPEAITGRATIVIALLDENSDHMTTLGFDRIFYVGSIENENVNLNEIILIEGYSEAVSFRFIGDLESYFTAIFNEGTITVILNNPIPEQLIPENRLITLELEASAPGAVSAFAAIIIEALQDDVAPVLERLVFDEAYYTGQYTELDGLIFEDIITLTEGYDDNVDFVPEGDAAQYFQVVILSVNTISLRMSSPIPSAIMMNNKHLIFTIQASKPNAIPATATIIILLNDEYTEITPRLGFNRISYVGSTESGVVNLEPVILSEGYSSNVTFTLHGELQPYFTLNINEEVVLISLTSEIPEELMPSSKIILLEIQASAPDTISAHATIVLEVVQEDIEELVFSEPYYTGYYSADQGLGFDATITLTQGYDESVRFLLDGDHSEWFEHVDAGNSVSIILAYSIPADILESNTKLIFVIIAQKSEMSTRATVIISITQDVAECTDVSFGKILYEGHLQADEVQHETITVSGYDGTDVQLFGEYYVLFQASLSDGVVTIQASESIVLSTDISYVPLEIRVGPASAVLLLDVVHDENPVLPSVTFSSSSYAINTDVTHTGLVGQVLASADNGEAVTYSLTIDDTHLQQRVTVTNDGDLYLWAPANAGVYGFQVRATTVFSQVSGTADIHLTVEAITIWDNDYVLPPLQILDRDEESPYVNLVPFNTTAFEGCRYSLSNRWPTDQSWLYVDENGLHAHAIDREHESIAFMALSQIQVQLTLQCDSDTESTRLIRPYNNGFEERLGPYDYGNSNWILTDSINYNPRRSLVNLIVNDINDNYPIFIGKEDEPIVIGYPVPDLEERILPRALAELQATDADVGENAALVYWSTEEVLAVSSTTGSVHVRDITALQNDAVLTVHATDRNGQGLTGSLDLLVKLVDSTQIAVVTIKGAFLDDEKDILNNLTAAVGYEVKALRSSVISDTESEELDARRKREAILSSGASLQLYVYGLIERQPVNVERLTGDINTSNLETVVIASTVSLEDYLENLTMCPLPERDIALFVSTIVLAVLLFILIVAVAVWFFLKWRKNKNYEEFSDENSVASRDEPLPTVPLPVTKPEEPAHRMNIEDLKRSERRLQEMLEAPVNSEITVEKQPTKQTPEKPTESKVTIQDLPIVFQSFDKLKDADESDDGNEDEFGEKLKNRRKSVVTFNENVEKIIHVEDSPEDNDYEVFRL